MPVTTSTIAQLATQVGERLQDPTFIFWQQRYEAYAAIQESFNDLLLLVGRPTIIFNTQIQLVPNTVWQPMPDNMIAITNIRGDQYSLWKTDVHTMDYLQNSWGCYDDQTEVLTKDGWKKFEDLKGDEEFATLERGENLVYQQPSAIHKYAYSGDLLSYRSNSVDLLVTPNHKIYISPMDSEKWNLVKAEDVKIKHFNMKKNASWVGREVKNITIAGKQIPMDLWLEFLGYFISEGYTSLSSYERPARMQKFKNKKTGEYRLTPTRARTQFGYKVGICQSSNSDVYEKMKACIDKMPFSFWLEDEGPNKHQWCVNHKALYEELQQLGKAHQKRIPEYIKDLCPRQLRIIYEAMMDGDGTVQPLSATYYTSSKLLADDFQEIVLKAGMASDVHVTDRVGQKCPNGIRRHPEYSVGIRRDYFLPRKASGWAPEKIHYEGMVHCVTVPNHIIYVRRNGRAIWCGNSDWECDVADSPLRWGPLGWDKFFVHPAPTTPILVNVSGIQCPVTTPWPPTGAEQSPFHSEFDVALQLYATAYLRLKELGDDSAEGQQLLDQYLDIAARNTTIEDRRDPLIFSRSLGTPTAPSLVSLR